MDDYSYVYLSIDDMLDNVYFVDYMSAFYGLMLCDLYTENIDFLHSCYADWLEVQYHDRY